MVTKRIIFQINGEIDSNQHYLSACSRSAIGEETCPLPGAHTRLTWAAFRSGLRERNTPTSDPNTLSQEVSLVPSDLLGILL